MSSSFERTLVLLPAFNESATIGSVIERVCSVLPEADCLVINDGSTDDTAAIAARRNATVVSHIFNMGYGVALQTGYKYAVQKGYEFLVQIDADGQHDPSCIPRVLERVVSGTCDLCIGSRFLEGTSYSIPLLRRAGMYIFRRIATRLIGTTITDPTSGFQAMNRRVVEFCTKDIYPTDYPDTDLLVLLHRNHFRIMEVPVRMLPTTSGKSIHSGMKPLYYLFKMTLDIPLNLIRQE